MAKMEDFASVKVTEGDKNIFATEMLCLSMERLLNGCLEK
jgi:hypothetical protein